MTTDGTKPSMATKLIELALRECVEFWHDESNDGFADFRSNGHLESMKIRSTGFRQFLRKLFFVENETAANNQAIAEAIDTLDGKAVFQGQRFKCNVRIGHLDGDIFLDLGNKHWQVIHINRHKWSVYDYDQVPVKFVRPKALLPLEMPIGNGELSDLRKLINVSDNDWVLVVAFLLSCFQPKGAYPILFVHGEQGSAKSTACRLIRQLIDDNISPVRAKARDEDALLIAAKNGAVVALDNLSFIDDSLSDSLCRLTTGAGLSKRSLYTDSDETILNVKRPILINGIPELASRGDLLSRSLILHLPSIDDDHRKTESQINEQFEKLRSSCLGGLLNAVVSALENQDQIRPDKLPRLADFFSWVVAGAEAAGLEKGQFESVYRKRLKATNRQAIDNSLIGSAIAEFANRLTEAWTGTTMTLLQELGNQQDPEMRHQLQRERSWPKTPRALGGQLRRLSPDLRRLGILINLNIDGRRTLEIKNEKG